MVATILIYTPPKQK